MIAGAIFVLLPLIFVLVVTTNLAERRVENARGVGETRILPFSGVAFEWLSNDVVVFQSFRGTTTVNLATAAIRETIDPTIVNPSAYRPRATFDELPDGGRYGPWQVRENYGYLKADDSGDVRCLMPLISPDGTHAACTYTVTDRMAESSDSAAAVVRLR